MTDQYKSAFIFELIEEFEVLSKSGAPGIFTDEAYTGFCDKYKLVSKQRDIALKNYLKTNSNLYRTYLPYSKWAFSVAKQVFWYYDELVLNDPVIGLMDWARGDIEYRKNQLREQLIFLIENRKNIEGGYLLLGGSDILPYNPDKFIDGGKELISVPNIINAFERRTVIGKKPAYINDDPNDVLQQLFVQYQGL